MTLSYFIGQHKYNPAKMSPYECGMEPVGNARQRFYREVLPGGDAVHPVRRGSRVPLSLGHRAASAESAGLGMFWFWEMLVYIGIVLAGFWYVWKKGVLDWNKQGKAERI